MNRDSIIFIHRRCFTHMQRILETTDPEIKERVYLYECPECHYFITCNIQEFMDKTIEIQNVCENCGRNMNVLPDYVTPQRGIIYYRCHKCG